MKIANTLLIGGKMAFSFLAANGNNIGGAKVSKENIKIASKLLRIAKESNTKFILPVDFVTVVDQINMNEWNIKHINDLNDNEIWDDAEKFTDVANGIWDSAETFSDGNSNGIWDKGNWIPEVNNNMQVIHIIAQQFAYNVHYAGPDGKWGPRHTHLIDTDRPYLLSEYV